MLLDLALVLNNWSTPFVYAWDKKWPNIMMCMVVDYASIVCLLSPLLNHVIVLHS